MLDPQLQRSWGTPKHGAVQELDHQDRVLYLNILAIKSIKRLDTTVPSQEQAPSALTFKALECVPRAVAMQMVTCDETAALLVGKFPEAIPQKLEEMGLSVRCDEVFRQGSFIAFKLTVQHCNADQILGAHAGHESRAASGLAGWVFSFTSSCGCSQAGMPPGETVDERMSAMIARKLFEALPKQLPPKLTEDGLTVEVVAKKEDDEETYLKTIQEELFSGVGSGSSFASWLGWTS